jgi:Ca-activated chloride channel family protein
LEKSERPRYVVFLTDGLPTSGETNIDTILKHAKTKNEGRARIFVFGVGFDVDVHFLDRLAEENSGVSEYVRPAEDIEAKVSTFFNKVSAPVMTDIALEVSGSKVFDVFPQKNYPHLFEGSQLIVVGSYRQPGPVTIKLSGEVAGRKRTFELQGKLAQHNEEHDFVPLVWASRKIGYLMDEVRLHGQNQELVDEIIRLSKEFGIMTEFTAFLVTEPNLGREEAKRRTLDQVSKAKGARSGAWATGQAQNARRLSAAAAPQAMGGGKGGFGGFKDSFGVSAAPAAPAAGMRSANQAFIDREGRVQTMQGVQNVSNRAFYQQGKVWIDQSVTAKMPVVRIQQYSKASFQLAAASKLARRFLAVGDEVKFVLNGQAVVAGSQGKTELTESELKKLVGAKPAASSQRPKLEADQMQAKEKYGLPLIIGILAAPAILMRRRRKIA